MFGVSYKSKNCTISGLGNNNLLNNHNYRLVQRFSERKQIIHSMKLYQVYPKNVYANVLPGYLVLEKSADLASLLFEIKMDMEADWDKTKEAISGSKLENLILITHESNNSQG